MYKNEKPDVMRFKFSLLIGILFLASSAICQNTKPELTVQKIMQEPDQWIGSLPENQFWSDDSKTVYFDWNPEKEPGTSLYQFDIKNQVPKKVSIEDLKAMPSRRGIYTRNHKKKLFVKSGNVFIYDIEKNSTKKIVNTQEYIRSAQFTFDEEEIVLEINNNLFLLNLENGSYNQITNIQEKKYNKRNDEPQTDSWYADQQKELFKVFEDKNKERQFQNKQRMALREPSQNPFYISGDWIFGFSLSPNKRFVTFMESHSTGKGVQTEMMNYVTETGYAKSEKTREKVGGPESYMVLNIIDLEKDSSYTINYDNIPGLNEWPEYYKEYGVEKNEPRKVSVFGPNWSEDGKYAIVDIRSVDHKDRWIMLLDSETGNLELLDRQHDEAWIAGPGISSWGMRSNLNWMPDNECIWYQSEESGYTHIYKQNVITKEKTPVTKGEFEIYDPFISDNGKYWYYTSNEVHPGERHFYRKPVNGGEAIQLTSLQGRNDVEISPDEKWLAIRNSHSNKPWELFLQANKPGAKAKKITSSLTNEFKEYSWREPKVISYKAQDETEVYARLYTPNEDVKNGAAVIFVHGAGYLQNAHKWWSKYFREYMFHNLLADKGFTVLDIDYRGSAGYGRDFRTGIYRHMGGKDLSDHVYGAKWLIENQGIDSEKIGIYGGSYGGFITLMALFKEPDVFAAGAALRSVTDWAHYNHYYTSNILNTPKTDSIAYRRSSPIYFAEGLEDPLLMCHGMIDDNVHYQDIVRLVQRLIELEKDNWELAVYPIEPHTFTEPSSWTDEYKRILKLFEDNLLE
jgi:dipeptidyl aminopeptidase/acylaminoacyl peptidase